MYYIHIYKGIPPLKVGLYSDKPSSVESIISQNIFVTTNLSNITT